MSISDKMRASIEKSSLIRKMFEEGIKLKKEYGADNVFDFSLGNPDIPPPSEFTEILMAKATTTDPEFHSLPPEEGLAQVHEAISKIMTAEQGIAIAPEDVIMTYGAAGALNITFKALLDPEDEVIIFKPYFVDYNSYVENHGGIPVFVSTDADFNLDINAVAEAITPRTKAVIINSPNNPTGQVYSKESLVALGDLLQEKSKLFKTSIFLISDEPYRKIIFGDVVVPSVFQAHKNVIVVTSFSKDLSLPGERIGYLAVHPDIEDKQMLLEAMRFANKILGFYGPPVIMQHVIADISATSIDTAIYLRRKQIFCDILYEAGYSFMEPKGTFYIFPKAPGFDDVKFCQYLKEERILAVPGIGFGTPGYFRLAFCVPENVIERSATGFKKAIVKATG